MTLTKQQIDEFISDKDIHDYDRETEQDILLKLDDLLADADVLWDVGSHAGLYAIIAANVYPSLDIYCFEASEITRRQKLHSNIDEFDNITVVPHALADEHGTVQFQESGVGQTNNAIKSTTISPDEHTVIEIEAHSARTAVDELGIPCPDCVKLDIEGAEYTALQAFDQALLDEVSTVLVELHHIDTVDKATVPYLKEYGFDVSAIANRSTAENRQMEHIKAE